MVSLETFNKMSSLSRKIEEEEKDNNSNRTTPKEYNYLNLLANISTNYFLVKAYDEKTNNYHFQLRKIN